jgi:AcrR family transcriptional regulator
MTSVLQGLGQIAAECDHMVGVATPVAMASYLSTGNIPGDSRGMARPYHHGHLREAALAEATALVDAGEPLGLRELGRRLDVSHTAVHHHVATVDAVADALAARWFVDLDRAMAAAVANLPAARTIDRFRALGVAYVRYALAHPHRYRLQFRGGATGLVTDADASFRRVLEAVVACRRPVDPMAITTLAWSAMHGLAMLWIDGAFHGRLDRKGIDRLTETITGLIAQLLDG